METRAVVQLCVAGSSAPSGAQRSSVEIPRVGVPTPFCPGLSWSPRNNPHPTPQVRSRGRGRGWGHRNPCICLTLIGGNLDGELLGTWKFEYVSQEEWRGAYALLNLLQCLLESYHNSRSEVLLSPRR